MAVLTRDQVIGARADRLREVVPCPELGGDLIVQGMTAGERNRYEFAVIKQKKGTTSFDVMAFRSTLLRFSLVDEAGALIFEDSNKQIIDGWPAAVVERLVDTARRLSGIGEKDEEDLGLRSANALAGSSPSV